MAHGKVTHNGKPVPAGRLLFYYKDGPVLAPATIRPDGTYVAYDLPPGTARVALFLDPGGKTPPQRLNTSLKDLVRWNAANPGAMASAKTARGPTTPKGLKFPFSDIRPQLVNFNVPARDLPALQRLHAKYSSPYGESSPQLTVKPGPNKYDITLR